MNPWTLLMRLFRWLGRLLLPMLGPPRLSGTTFWIVHVLVVAAILVGLWWLQQRWMEIGRNLTPYAPELLREIWLPLLVLAIYLLCWLGYWLYQLLQPVEPYIPFPDLEEAWNAITAELHKAGIDPYDTPIYVLFGQLPKDEASFFTSLLIRPEVTAVPSRTAPVRCYAHRQAIFLVCNGVTLLEQIDRQAFVATSEQADDEQSIAFDPAQSIKMGQSIAMSMSHGSRGSLAAMGGNFSEIQAIIRQAQAEGRPLNEEEKAEIRRLSHPEDQPRRSPAGAAANKQPRLHVLQDAMTVAEQTARMSYLLRRVAETRWPLCPLNGAIVLLSARQATQEHIAAQLGVIARQDLLNLITAARLRFPTYVLLTELDELPGANEFLRRFATVDRRDKRLGKGFPLEPDLPSEQLAPRVEESVRWTFAGLLPYVTYKQLRVETGDETAVSESIQSNAALLAFLRATRTQAAAIARMVSRAVVPDGTWLNFGGCYTTAQYEGRSLFLKDFFRKLDSTQSYVAWTEQAFAEDAWYGRAVRLGYLALGGVVLGVIGLGVWVYIS